MPRRQKPGGYSNRTDLQSTPRTLTPRDQGYGARKKFESAASTPEARSAMGGGGAGAGQPSPGGDLFAAALARLQQGGMGGVGAGSLSAPTTRPGEPPTAGLPTGPGAGPEVVPDLLSRGPSPDVRLWQPYMPMLELLASRPDSSSELRQFYRRLRAQMPVDPYRQPTPE